MTTSDESARVASRSDRTALATLSGRVAHRSCSISPGWRASRVTEVLYAVKRFNNG